MFLILGVYGVFELVTDASSKIRSKFKEGFTEMRKQSEENNLQVRNQAYADSLRAMVPDYLQEEIPEDFYETGLTDLGEYWIPTMYPYAVSADTYFQWAYLLKTSPEEKEVVYGITEFAFDGNWFVCKVDNYPNKEENEYQDYDEPPFFFLAVQFYDDVQAQFTSLNGLMEFVKERGYQGPEELDALEVAYYKGL